MNICQGVGNIFIVAIDGMNSVHIFEPAEGVAALWLTTAARIRDGN
jgi:hypothetical protein